MTSPTETEWHALVHLFDLGSLTGLPMQATSGWGGHNIMWKVTTDTGTWAVKEVGRVVPANSEDAFTVEAKAHAAGVPMPRPVVSVNNLCFDEVGSKAFRCHEWADGTAKKNEQVTKTEAHTMGGIVAQLHGLEIPTEPPTPRSIVDADEWLQLALRGKSSGAPWAGLLEENVKRLVAIQTEAQRASNEPEVGSHRDLNAHNVLFNQNGMVLIDWDAAGPAVPATESAVVSMLWSQKQGGTYDRSRTEAFLHGYQSGGGRINTGDAARLTEWLDGLVSWMHENIRLAISMDTAQQHAATKQLLVDTLNGPDTIAVRQQFLEDVIDRLSPRLDL